MQLPIQPKNEDNKKAVGVEVGGKELDKIWKKRQGRAHAPKSDSEMHR